MNNITYIHCSACGAKLDTEINREYIFCKYCGSKNRIESEAMRTNISLGNINITAKTEISNLISSAKYLIGIKQYDKANEVLIAATISGCDDYRVYVCKAMLDLHTGDDHSLFYTIDKLKTLEATQYDNEVTHAVKELMMYRGNDDITVLHAATFNEKYDITVFCVEHGSDVNALTSISKRTPISIMFVPLTENFRKLDGTTFRDEDIVKMIRSYLLQHGAKDDWRMGYDSLFGSIEKLFKSFTDFFTADKVG
jgi:transcription elongation factor Elf1